MNTVMDYKVQREPTSLPAPLPTSFLTIEKLPFFSCLSPWQRIMLVSDGNLTHMLQAYFLEDIGVRVEAQQVTYQADDFGTEGDFLKRQIVLYGKKTFQPYVYAESLLSLKDLPIALTRELQHDELPLGRLWLKHRLETFKELIDVRVSTNETASRYLDQDDSSLLLARTYYVFSRGRKCMVIHEYFPVAFED
jgi:chorismate-pyruvate lyase